MKAFPIFPRPSLHILKLAVLAGVVIGAARPCEAGERIIFSGRFEKRGLPDLTDRDRLLPGSVDLFPQTTAPGPDFAIPQASSGATLTRRQQEILDQRRNWIEHGQKRNGDASPENPNAPEQPGDRERDRDRDPRGNTAFDRAEQKPDAKRAPGFTSSREPGASRNPYSPVANSRDETGRPDNRLGAANNDPYGRATNPGARLPGESLADGRGGVELPTARVAPRLGLGADSPIQQKLDRDSQFRQLLDPKTGDSARANDVFSVSPELSRQQQQQNMGRAFEDILRRHEPIRSLDSLRPKSPLAANPLNADGPKSGNLTDFSRIMAPAPAPERPRPSVAPTEFPKRAF